MTRNNEREYEEDGYHSYEAWEYGRFRGSWHPDLIGF